MSNSCAVESNGGCDQPQEGSCSAALEESVPAEDAKALGSTDPVHEGKGTAAAAPTGLISSELNIALEISTEQDLNLCSAFAHVLADTMRTLTVMVCALLVWVGGLDSKTTDALGSLAVAGVILIVAVYVAVETARSLKRLIRGQALGNTQLADV